MPCVALVTRGHQGSKVSVKMSQESWDSWSLGIWREEVSWCIEAAEVRLEPQGGLWGKILMWKGACTVPIYQAPVGHPHTGQILSSPGFSHCSKHRGSLRT